MAERPEAPDEILGLLESVSFEMFEAGPAFQAGRYGIACGRACVAVKAARQTPCVTGMSQENPGAEQFRRETYIVPTAASAKDMAPAIEAMARLAVKLGLEGAAGSPTEGGYLAQGRTINVVQERLAAERAVAMVLAKANRQTYATEIPLLTPEHVPPAPALKSLADAKIALVTEGGLVPSGNPDGLVGARASRYEKYEIASLTTLPRGDYESVHRGYDTSQVNADPNRLVPLDVARQLEREGAFRQLHEYYYVTSGCATWIKSSRAMAQKLAGELRAAQVDGVILTAT